MGGADDKAVRSSTGSFFTSASANAANILKYLDNVPARYKQGEWTLTAHLYIFSFVSFMLIMLSDALGSRVDHVHSHPDVPWLPAFRLGAGLYAVAISVITYRTIGFWPFYSYTFLSWNLMALRMLSAFLATVGLEMFAIVADMCRFPALVGCTITVVIWWVVLVPIIHTLLKGPEERANFWKWNSSFTLVNVHLLNLPLIAVEVYISSQKLTFFDLYMGMLVALLYMLFYLNFLDPRGMHFYIILTPRSHWCALSYSLILAIYYGVFRFWSAALA